MLGLGWVQLIIQPKESKMHKQEENKVCVCVYITALNQYKEISL